MGERGGHVYVFLPHLRVIGIDTGMGTGTGMDMGSDGDEDSWVMDKADISMPSPLPLLSVLLRLD